MDRDQYIKEAQNKLADEKEPTSKYKRKIDDVMQEALESGIITSDTRAALVNDFPRVPLLYLVPKIHKDLKTPRNDL